MPTTATAANDAAPRRKGRPRVTETAAPSLVEILNLVRTEQATTRQEIERQSELGRAVVADRLGTLGELGLVDESELATASGGRAPRLVRFATDRGRILVATLDQTALGVGIADLGGSLLMEHHEATELSQPVSALADRLVTLFRWILERHSDIQLYGISISVPGAVSDGAETLFQRATPGVLPGWESFPLVETLVAAFDAPVWLRSSVETMTMGELHAGAGRNQRTMMFVKVGKRIGAGLASDGILFRGAQGPSASSVLFRSPSAKGQALLRRWRDRIASPRMVGLRQRTAPARFSPISFGVAPTSRHWKSPRPPRWAMPPPSISWPRAAG